MADASAVPKRINRLPRGVPNSFANLTGEPVRVIGLILPSGPEKMFVQLHTSAGCRGHQTRSESERSGLATD
jgi:hypothetical protein